MPEIPPKSPRKRKIFTFKNKRRMPTWLAWLLALLVKLYSWTFRFECIDEGGILENLNPWPVVFSLWHNRILFIAAVGPKKMRENSAVLISSSRDGEYVSSFIRFFGLGVVRGSSSKGAVQGLLGLERIIQEGKSTILTLDGPRGPRYSVHPGAVLLAQHNGIPVMPVSLNCSSYWTVRSWDRMQIPKPFARVTLHFGLPLFLENLEREAAIAQISEAMSRITKD